MKRSMSAQLWQKYNVTPVDTKWVDSDKAFGEEPMQIRPRIVASEFKSGDRPDVYAGAPLPGSSERYHVHCCGSQSRVLTGAC